MQWVPMINDLALGEVKEAHKAGLVSFKMCVHDQDRNGDIDWEDVPSWSLYPNEKPEKYALRCHIYQCSKLPSSDDNGTSDPYIKLYSPFKPDEKQKEMTQTKTANDNNNPIFYQTIESYFYARDIYWAPPIVLEIYDRDTGIFASDDYIGRAVIDITEDNHTKDDTIAQPKWHPVKLGFQENEPEMGRILVSISILDPGKEFAKSLDLIKLGPECEEYHITINVLGLRDLQSPGMLPIRKPFIRFMIKSLLSPSKSEAVENIETQPSVTGANPTISTVIKFKVLLPNDPLYCPSLTCAVYDYIFMGV